jgi:hypothetical protein
MVRVTRCYMSFSEERVGHRCKRVSRTRLYASFSYFATAGWLCDVKDAQVGCDLCPLALANLSRPHPGPPQSACIARKHLMPFPTLSCHLPFSTSFSFTSCNIPSLGCRLVEFLMMLTPIKGTSVLRHASHNAHHGISLKPVHALR